MILLVVLDFLLAIGLFALMINTKDKVLHWMAFSGMLIEIMAGIVGILHRIIH